VTPAGDVSVTSPPRAHYDRAVKFRPSALPDVVVVEPEVHRDGRGFFLETYHAEKFAAAGLPTSFVQDNHSRSSRGTLRGLHAQLEPAQGKLVRVVRGTVFDVAVDLRRRSATYLRWVSHVLSADEPRSLWIPPGFAHGFCVTSDEADVEYKCSAPYRPAGEVAIAWDDPRVGIAWPIEAPTLSDRDRAAPRVVAVETRFPT
jgi:dTDP-4-dehydrorhamnose 3,5-epimerase